MSANLGKRRKKRCMKWGPTGQKNGLSARLCNALCTRRSQDQRVNVSVRILPELRPRPVLTTVFQPCNGPTVPYTSRRHRFFDPVHDQEPLAGLSANWQSRPGADFVQPEKRSLNVQSERPPELGGNQKHRFWLSPRLPAWAPPPLIIALSLSRLLDLLQRKRIKPRKCGSLEFLICIGGALF